MKSFVRLLSIGVIILLGSCSQPSATSDSEPGTQLTETMVSETIDRLNQALVDRDGEALDMICADGLSYGHSSGYD